MNRSLLFALLCGLGGTLSLPVHHAHAQQTPQRAAIKTGVLLSADISPTFGEAILAEFGSRADLKDRAALEAALSSAGMREDGLGVVKPALLAEFMRAQDLEVIARFARGEKMGTYTLTMTGPDGKSQGTLTRKLKLNSPTFTEELAAFVREGLTTVEPAVWAARGLKPSEPVTPAVKPQVKEPDPMDPADTSGSPEVAGVPQVPQTPERPEREPPTVAVEPELPQPRDGAKSAPRRKAAAPVRRPKKSREAPTPLGDRRVVAMLDGLIDPVTLLQDNTTFFYVTLGTGISLSGLASRSETREVRWKTHAQISFGVVDLPQDFFFSLVSARHLDASVQLLGVNEPAAEGVQEGWVFGGYAGLDRTKHGFDSVRGWSDNSLRFGPMLRYASRRVAFDNELGPRLGAFSNDEAIAFAAGGDFRSSLQLLLGRTFVVGMSFRYGISRVTELESSSLFEPLPLLARDAELNGHLGLSF